MKGARFFPTDSEGRSNNSVGTNNNNRTYIASKQTFQIAMTTQKIYGHSTSEVRKPESF